MQSVTNLFIANLALADVVIGMFSIPFQVRQIVLFSSSFIVDTLRLGLINLSINFFDIFSLLFLMTVSSSTASTMGFARFHVCILSVCSDRQRECLRIHVDSDCRWSTPRHHQSIKVNALEDKSSAEKYAYELTWCRCVRDDQELFYFVTSRTLIPRRNILYYLRQRFARLLLFILCIMMLKYATIHCKAAIKCRDDSLKFHRFSEPQKKMCDAYGYGLTTNASSSRHGIVSKETIETHKCRNFG